jgi:hypothetical protein
MVKHNKKNLMTTIKKKNEENTISLMWARILAQKQLSKFSNGTRKFL